MASPIPSPPGRVHDPSPARTLPISSNPPTVPSSPKPNSTRTQLPRKTRMAHAEPFSRLLASHWLDLATRLRTQKTTTLDGQSLTIPAVILAARYGGTIELDPRVLPRIERSSQTLKELVSKGVSIYGVNTGFGGSADVRTKDYAGLQGALLRMLQFGIISNNDLQQSSSKLCEEDDISSLLHNTAQATSASRPAMDMPPSWVRGAIAIRVNSLCQGASGISPSTVRVLVDLLAANIIPQVPIRGSISASGDLSPLAYIAGAMSGNPAVKAYVDNGTQLIPSSEALARAGITPAVFGAKEALAVTNGTACSASVAALALHEILQLGALAQLLTAMSVEALAGTPESFDPFIAALRPHPGQIDSARCIRGFLAGSQLVSGTSSSAGFSAAGTLAQDRYALRTSSQWIGPVLEDLQLAYTQLSTELNSVTDNPVIDSARGIALSGGNFQARAVHAAMEKARQAAQTLGKMLFAQCTELINPVTNRGLPPNLVVDEPSASFLFKGADIMVAALSSELGFLSAPVNHVEHAEMGNQGVNSLALVSARYTLEAGEVLGQLVATHLGAVCQGLDLRVMQMGFRRGVRGVFEGCFGALVGGEELEGLWTEFNKTMDATTSFDAAESIEGAAKGLQRHLADARSGGGDGGLAKDMSFAEFKSLTDAFASRAKAVFKQNREAYMASPDATPYLGKAGKAMYTFIRRRLGVPFVSEAGLQREKIAFGTAVQGPIYAAIRSGAFWPVVVGCFEQAQNEDEVRAKL